MYTVKYAIDGAFILSLSNAMSWKRTLSRIQAKPTYGAKSHAMSTEVRTTTTKPTAQTIRRLFRVHTSTPSNIEPWYHATVITVPSKCAPTLTTGPVSDCAQIPYTTTVSFFTIILGIIQLFNFLIDVVWAHCLPSRIFVKELSVWRAFECSFVEFETKE